MSNRFDQRQEHTLESKPDEADATGVLVRRFELITGTGRRRRWSTDEKARILVESLKPGANISEVARRNGLSPQQLFGWRREVRCDPAVGRSGAPGKEARALISESADAANKAAVPDPTAPTPSPVHKRGRPKQDRGERYPSADTPTFAAVVIAAPAAPPSSPLAGASPSGTIEITIGDAVVRVGGQVDVALLATVLRAVRRAS